MRQNEKEIFTKEDLEDQLVEVPGGFINLKDDRTSQNWTVEIQPFLLGKFPVTQDFYFRVTRERRGSSKDAESPVTDVTWKDAANFCNALSLLFALTPCYIFENNNDTIVFEASANGYRLPTEAEWEYACKSGTTKIRYGELDKIAWFRGNSGGTIRPVGLKQPNLWGLYDMLGNVWEWCSDVYDKKVYGSYRVFRGGGWYDEERSVMATTRRRSHPTKFMIDDLGFRIARNIP